MRALYICCTLINVSFGYVFLLLHTPDHRAHRSGHAEARLLRTGRRAGPRAGHTLLRARGAVARIRHPSLVVLGEVSHEGLPTVKRTDVMGYHAQRIYIYIRLRATPSPWDIKQGSTKACCSVGAGCGKSLAHVLLEAGDRFG